MPPIYRHIVPNVPALTVGNGKPCFDEITGKPVYQKLMHFSVEWRGNLNLSAWKAEIEDGTPLNWLDLSMTAAEINTAFEANGGVGDDAYYNDTFSLPLMDNAYFGYNDTAFSYDFTSGGVTTKRFVPNFYLAVGLDWDANNQFWRWEARLYYFRMWYYYLTDRGTTEYHVCAFGSTTRAALFQSAQSTTNIRAGNGVTLDFVGRLPAGGVQTWVDPMLAGTSLVVSVQYA